MADPVLNLRRREWPARVAQVLGCGRPPAILALAFLVSLVTRCSGGASLTSAGDPGRGSGNDSGVPVLECDAIHLQTQCALPRSTCDADGQTLIYYTTPACVSGRCEWARATESCLNGCSNGACFFLGTVAPGPFPMPTEADASTEGATAEGASVDGGSGDDANADVDSATWPPAPLATCVGEASTCVLPASVCADSKHLLYFLNAACVDGGCQADVQSLTCYGLCANGACVGNPTR
jgi:hypothetical protein